MTEETMSYANFVKALELAPQCKFYTTAGGKSDEEIGASEKILGVTFSKQCKEFYKKLGYLSFFEMKYLELTLTMILEYWKETRLHML